MLGQSIGKNALLLSAVAVLTTAVLAFSYLQTESRIAENIRAAEERALLDIIPRDRHDNSMLQDQLTVDDPLLGLRQPKSAYRAKLQGEVVAVILPATARDGYTGDIDLIIGIQSNGDIAGVRVLSHRETPGLGDKVDYNKSTWVDGFIGRSLQDPTPERWTVRKDGGDFDQFTGATITPRAVTRAVYRALQYFQQHRSLLLQTDSRDDMNEVTDGGQ